jgi:hypothetical protein
MMMIEGTYLTLYKSVKADGSPHRMTRLGAELLPFRSSFHENMEVAPVERVQSFACRSLEASLLSF